MSETNGNPVVDTEEVKAGRLLVAEETDSEVIRLRHVVRDPNRLKQLPMSNEIHEAVRAFQRSIRDQSKGVFRPSIDLVVSALLEHALTLPNKVGIVLDYSERSQQLAREALRGDVSEKKETE